MLKIETIYAKLKRDYNIEKDELDTLGFKTEEQVREYYSNVAKQSGTLETEDEEDAVKDPVPKDGYKLSSARLRELRGNVKREKKQVEQKEKDKFFAKAADLSHLPPAERVSHDDVKKELEQLNAAFNPPRKASKIKIPKKS